jgi:S-adenosylmethionine-diacylglycerol 3-amino-3-carboxypropyl transferase
MPEAQGHCPRGSRLPFCDGKLSGPDRERALTRTSQTAPSIDSRARFDLVRYANCWEDADVLCEALRPAPGKRFLSVASAGDNSFALVADGATVVAADVSPAQLALVELKAAAIRRLDREAVLGFLGFRPATDRGRTLDALRPELSERALAFWSGRRVAIEAGVGHCGKFEGYFRLFRTKVLPWVHGRSAVRALLEERDESGRRAFYEKVWNNRRWRLLFRVFFSRFVMGRLGRDPEFFRYVEGSVADRILERARYALTVLPTHENPYLEYIFTGNFGRTLPRWLRPGPFAALRGRLNLLTLFEGPIENAALELREGGFDGFNLSDVFEYLDPAKCRGMWGTFVEAARPSARFAYWNMLVPRRCPEDLASRVEPLSHEAERLFRRDLAFFYSAFVLERAR